MTAKDIFALVVRVLGLLIFLWGLLYGVACILQLLHLSTHPDVTPQSVAAAAICFTILGLIILLSAKPITRLIYGREG